MIDKYLQIETLSVVIIGDFNPPILQPFWLSSKNLIREEEAKNAKIEIIHNDIVRYEINDWLNVEVTKKRCEFRTSKEPYFKPLKDLSCGIFSILKETPFDSVGINNIYELNLQSQKKFYEFGSKLTPLNYWDTSLNDPRLLNLEIYEEVKKDIPNSSRRVRITSSDKIISFGVTININNHFNLKFEGNKKDLITTINDNWDICFESSKMIIEELFTKINIQ